jgi:hypothetical protein
MLVTGTIGILNIRLIPADERIRKGVGRGGLDEEVEASPASGRIQELIS